MEFSTHPERRRAVAVLSFFVVAVLPLAAQPRLVDERTAVELALLADAAAAVQRLDLAAKERRAETRSNIFLPSLSASAVGRERLPNIAAGAPRVETGIVQVGSSLTLSAEALQKGRTAELDVAVSRALTRAAVEKTEKETRKAFYRLILLREQAETAAAAAEVSRGSMERAAEEYRNGLASERTRRQAEVDYATSRLALARRRADYDAARAEFSRRIALPDGSWTLEGALDIEPVDEARLRFESGFIVRRADVAKAVADIAVQESRIEEARRARTVPTLTLSALVDLTKTGAADPVSAGQFSLTLSSPNLSAFLPFSADSVSLESSRLTLEKLRLQAEESSRSAVLEVESLIRSLSVSASAIASLSSAVELAEEVVVLTREAYDAGAVSFQDLRTSEREADSSRASLLSERYAYLAALIDLEYAVGKPLRSAKESS